MPAVSRAISIVYGSTTVGGSTDYLLDGEVRVKENLQYGRATVSFSFWVFATTDNAFVTATNAVETAFTTPRQKLSIKLNGSDWKVWDPTAGASGNTGFWQAPTINKVGDDADTLRSRRYEVTIEIQTPADLSGQSGRLYSTVSLEIEQGSRKRVVISGRYTALTTNDARAQYLAAIGTYESSVCDSLIGANAWELVHRQREDSDDANKNLDFVRIYRETLLAQSQAALDDPDVVDQVLVCTRGRIAPGDTQFPSRPVARLQDLRVRYFAWVPGRSVDLRDKWETVIRPWVLEHLQAVTGASSLAVMAEDPTFDYGNRSIECMMSCVATNGSNYLESSVTTTDTTDPGVFLGPVWSGDPYAAHVFRGPAVLERTITTTIRRVLTGADSLIGVTGPVADVSAVTRAQDALGLSIGTFNGSPGVSLDYPSGGSGAKAAPASLVPTPLPPNGGGQSGFLQVGPQITTRTPRTLGLVSTTLDVVDEQTIRRLRYRTAPV